MQLKQLKMLNQSINSHKGEKIGEHSIDRELKLITWMLLDILMPQYRQQSLRNQEDSWFDKKRTKNQQNQDHLYIIFGWYIGMNVDWFDFDFCKVNFLEHSSNQCNILYKMVMIHI